eukprot:6600253-Pyramimonas_sp.AAC.1
MMRRGANHPFFGARVRCCPPLLQASMTGGGCAATDGSYARGPRVHGPAVNAGPCYSGWRQARRR